MLNGFYFKIVLPSKSYNEIQYKLLFGKKNFKESLLSCLKNSLLKHFSSVWHTAWLKCFGLISKI